MNMAKPDRNAAGRVDNFMIDVVYGVVVTCLLSTASKIM